jgi:hypothetical protein
LPAQIISWDVTCELVGKTVEDTLAGTGFFGCAVVCNMCGCVLPFVFIKSKSDTHWKQIMHDLQECCERFGGSEDAANVVEHGHMDTHNKHVKDQEDHWFLKAWPDTKDAPFKDWFHAMKMVCGPKPVRGSSSDLHANFCHDLSSCVLHSVKKTAFPWLLRNISSCIQLRLHSRLDGV